MVRKTFGDALAEDLRFVLKSCIGEENFVDMNPNMSNNYCCGGGGGFLQNPYKEERIQYGQKEVGSNYGDGSRLLHHAMPQLPFPDS